MNSLNSVAPEIFFRRALSLSLSFHFALVALLAVRAVWMSDEAIMVQDAMRVDLVALPEKSKPTEVSEALTPKTQPAQKVEPTPITKPEAKPETTKPPEVSLSSKKEDLKKAEDSQRKALERLKAMQAIEKLKSESAEKAAKANPKDRMIRGNQVASGDSLTGLERIEYDRYFGQIEKQIKANWHLPGWLSNSELRAQALVLIDGDGQLIRKQIRVSSGNETFDNYVLEAIERSVPFPVPPDKLKDILSVRGIVFKFPN